MGSHLAGRTAILAVHARKVKLEHGLDLEQIGAMTPGFTGADLANLVNEAALVATRRDGGAVTLADFTNAVERIVAGLEKKNRLLNSCEREIVAVHEMGHAIVASALPGTDPVHKVSIIPRGIGALGYTIQRPTEDRFLMTRTELEHKMAVLLGGRAAEHLVFRHLSTGAGDDLARATEIARDMVTRYAMIPELGNSTYASDPPGFLPRVPTPSRDRYSEATAREIDCAIRDLVDAAVERAYVELDANRQLLKEAARKLLEEESIAGDQLEKLLQRVQRAPRRASA